MAFTRKFLSALGIEAEKQDEIINAHAEVVDGLKGQLDAKNAEIEKLSGVQKELDDLKADLKTKYVTKEDHDKTVTEYAQYKDGITKKEVKAAKEAAARAYFKGKKITDDKNLALAMRGSSTEIEALELDENGKIKDAKALDELIGGDFAGLVTKDNAGARIDTGGALGGGQQPPQQSRAAQLYQQHYEALYGAQKGNESK